MTDQKKAYTLSLESASLWGAALSLPMLALMVGAYVAFSPDHYFAIGQPGAQGTFLFIGAVLLGIFAHEIIHALAWAAFGNVPLRRMRINFQAQMMTPYAHSLEPLPVNAYRLGAALPGLLLGAAPFMAGTLLGKPSVALFGILFSITASGDLLVLWITRSIKASEMVQDHPSLVGCIVVDHGDAPTPD